MVRDRAADIPAQADRLGAYARLPAETFAPDGERGRAARYGVPVTVAEAAETLAPICARICRPPGSHPGCFALRGELGILDSRLAAQLAAPARLRNLLVHGYTKVGGRQLHGLLPKDLGDLEAFLKTGGSCAFGSWGRGLPRGDGGREIYRDPVGARDPLPVRLGSAALLEHAGRGRMDMAVLMRGSLRRPLGRSADPP